MTDAIDPQRIASIVDAVVRRLQTAGMPPTQQPASASRLARFTPVAGSAALPTPPGGSVIFRDLDVAVQTARAAHHALHALPLAIRKRAIEAIREATREAAPQLAALAVAETGLGRVDDKIKKNMLVANATPGPEDLEPRVYTGDHDGTVHQFYG